MANATGCTCVRRYRSDTPLIDAACVCPVDYWAARGIAPLYAARGLPAPNSWSKLCRLRSRSDTAAAWRQGPCTPTIAGHAVNPSMEALMRHPCRIRSRDGGRARTSREGRRACLSTKQPANFPVRRPYRLRDPMAAWPRHGAYRDVLAACPASGKGAALSTHQAFDCIRKDDDILRSAVQCGWKIQGMLQSLSDRAAPWLQGPCPPTIAGHAVNPSMEALMRHPCRIRSRDGGRARTGKKGRYVGFSTKRPTNVMVRCPYRLRDPVAARMPPRSLQGRTCGVSRKR